MKPNQSHVAGLELALERWNEGGPAIQFAHLLADLIAQAQSAPEPVQGEAVATDAFVPGSLADLLFQLGEKGIGVSGGTHGDHWAFRSAAAKPDAELVELLRDAAAWFEGRDIDCNLTRDIDAKLASLNPRT